MLAPFSRGCTLLLSFSSLLEAARIFLEISTRNARQFLDILYFFPLLLSRRECCTPPRGTLRPALSARATLSCPLSARRAKVDIDTTGYLAARSEEIEEQLKGRRASPRAAQQPAPCSQLLRIYNRPLDSVSSWLFAFPNCNLPARNSLPSTRLVSFFLPFARKFNDFSTLNGQNGFSKRFPPQLPRGRIARFQHANCYIVFSSNRPIGNKKICTFLFFSFLRQTTHIARRIANDKDYLRLFASL